MIGFEMLLGHLVGDYIFQTDFLAQNKTTRSWVCLVHCLLYTFAVAVFCYAWFPLWGYAFVCGVHFPIDRFGLAHWWMQGSGQAAFSDKSGPFWPWSVIMVDNISHLLTLYAVAKVAGY